MPVSKSRLVAKWLNSFYRDTQTQEVESTHLDELGGGLPIQITSENIAGSFQEINVLTADYTNNAETTKIYHPVNRLNTQPEGDNSPAIETHYEGIRVRGKGTLSWTTYQSDGVFSRGVGFDGRDGTAGRIRLDEGSSGYPSIVSNYTNTTTSDFRYADMSHIRSHTPMAYKITQGNLAGEYPIGIVNMSSFSSSPNVTLNALKVGQEVLFKVVCDNKSITWPSGLTWLNNGGSAPTLVNGQTLTVAIIKMASSPDAYDAWVLGNA